MPRPGSAPAPGLPQDLMPDVARVNPPVLAAPPAAAPPPAAAKPAVIAPAPLAKPALVPAKPVAAAPKTTTPAAAKPAPPEPSPAKKPGTVQLGAFSSVEKANAAWAGLATKPGLGGFTKRIMLVESDAKTLYRLRASGGDAAELCRSLKAAGAVCTVVE